MDGAVEKILGCFLSGFTGMESHPEYSFLRKTDKAQERLSVVLITEGPQ